LETPWKEVTVNGKISFLQFHPFVANTLVAGSTSFDSVDVDFWDLTSDSGEPKIHLSFDIKVGSVEDIAFENTCNRIAIATKDGVVRIWNPRTKKELQTFNPENSQLSVQSLFISSSFMITVGFRSGSRRTISMWDLNDTSKSKKDVDVDNTNSLMLPYYDPDSQILFIASQGGNFIRFYQISESAPYIDYLNMLQSKGDVTGWSFLPKASVDVKQVEILKCLKLTKEQVLPISWSVPRKRMEYFQDDLYASTLFLPVASANEFFGDVEIVPNFYSLQPEGMELLSKAPSEELTERQLRYREQLAKKDKPKVTGATGHSSAAEVQDHFKEVANTMPKRNRWDADQEESQDVDEEEWD